MNAITLWFHKLGSPPYFYRFAGRLMPWLLGACLAFAALALWIAFTRVPPDYLQGQSAKIMYVHVPSAWMSLFVYAFMAIMGGVGFIWRIKLAEIMAMASAPIGAAFTVITLATGSLWGRPAWGTYWEWDGRMTSELILLFLYFGVIGLYRSIEDPRRAARAAALLAIVGLVNLPVIRYSVDWWATMHQSSSISVFAAKSSIDASMLWPLLWMALATKFYFGWALLGRARVAVLEQEAGKEWVREAVGVHAGATA